MKIISCFSPDGTGGTAFNGVVEELKKLTTRVAHVLPVSDDGGSTAEIVRVLGNLCTDASIFSYIIIIFFHLLGDLLYHNGIFH